MGQTSEKYDIKTFKPRVGDIQQGWFHPTNPEKYIGDITKIIYRSSWELRFLRFCDTSPAVIRYESEPLYINYYDVVTKKVRKYFIDFYVELDDRKGGTHKWLIEVKPKKFLFQPKPPKNNNPKSWLRYKKDCVRYINNKMKFEAAGNYAKEHGMVFGRITENFIFNRMR